MNIPEINIDPKQNARSENVVAVEAEEKLVRESTARVGPDAVRKQDGARTDKNPKQFTREELDKIVQETQKHLENNDVKLKFKLIEESDSVQVEIVDGDGNTIRKIPEDELLKLSKSLKDLDRGILDEVS